MENNLIELKDQNINQLEIIKFTLAKNYVEELELYISKMQRLCENAIDSENKLKNIKIPYFKMIS